MKTVIVTVVEGVGVEKTEVYTLDWRGTTTELLEKIVESKLCMCAQMRVVERNLQKEVT